MSAKKHLLKGEKLVRTTTPLGQHTGEFITTVETLPQLVEINKSYQGHTYFRWAGIKAKECSP